MAAATRTKARKMAAKEEEPAQEIPTEQPETAPENQKEEESFEQDFSSMEPTEQEQPTQTFTTSDFSPSKKNTNAKTIVWIVLIVLGLGALIGGGIYFYKARTAGNQTTPSETVSAPTPTPTSAQEVNLAEYNIQVLNGSGIAGEAGRAKALLAKAGFEDFEVGNAKTYDYTDTEIRTMSDTPNKVYDAAEDALTDGGYSVKRGTTLSVDSDFDIVITVGSKRVGGAATVVTPTPKPKTSTPSATTATPTPTKKPTTTPTPTKSTTPTPTP